MDVLGALGQQYMFILLVVLFLGFGLGSWALLSSIFKKEEPKGTAKAAVNNNINNIQSEKKKSAANTNIKNIIEGIKINNGWVKLGAISLFGLIISIGILRFASPNNTYNMNMQYGISQQSGMNTEGTMSMTANNNSSSMNNMGSMNNINGQAISPNYYGNLQDQLSQMQMQLNQMQQHLQYMNGK